MSSEVGGGGRYFGPHDAPASAPRSSFQDVAKRLEARAGKLQLTGRYHLPPKRLEDEYVSQSQLCFGQHKLNIYIYQFGFY